jgi:hypothetical protein
LGHSNHFHSNVDAFRLKRFLSNGAAQIFWKTYITLLKTYVKRKDKLVYGWHFMTDRHEADGHLLYCIVRNATIEIDQINTFVLAMP